jgi:hypothetical protein
LWTGWTEQCQVSGGGLHLLIMTKSKSLASLKVPPNPGDPGQLTVAVLCLSISYLSEKACFLTHWHSVWKGIVCLPSQLAEKVHGGCFAFQAVNFK